MPSTLATGFVALVVGFGLWWIFFDVGGRRQPRLDGLDFATAATAGGRGAG